MSDSDAPAGANWPSYSERDKRYKQKISEVLEILVFSSSSWNNSGWCVVS